MTPSSHASHPSQPRSGPVLLPPAATGTSLMPSSKSGTARPSPALLLALQQAWPELAGHDEILIRLASLGCGHRARQGARLLSDGVRNQAGGLWLLVRGKLSLGRQDNKGVWRQSRALHGGQWVDLVTAWTQAPFPESALALSPVVAHEFPALPVLDLCRQHPVLLATLLDSLSRSACDALESRQALATQDFPSRLAEWLLHEFMLKGQGDCLTLSQFKRDLAAQLGVTPETLSRTLRQFHEQGLIVMKHSQLRFPDPARLAALSQRPASVKPASP